MRVDPISWTVIHACGIVYRSMSYKWRYRLEGCRFQYWATGPAGALAWERRLEERKAQGKPPSGKAKFQPTPASKANESESHRDLDWS